MKATLAFLASLLLVATLLSTACNKGDTSSKRKKAKKKGTPILVIGTSDVFPPFEFYDSDGNLEGIDIDITRAIARHLNYETEIVFVPFNEILDAAAKGTIDIGAAGMTITEQRKELVAFSDTYYKSCQYLLVPRNSEIQGINDLKGKTIVVQSGTTAETFAKELPQDLLINILPMESAAEAVIDIIQQKSDALIIDQGPANAFYAKNKNALKLIPLALSEEEYGLFLAKEKNELMKKINQCLKTMKDSGELEEIIKRWE